MPTPKLNHYERPLDFLPTAPTMGTLQCECGLSMKFPGITLPTGKYAVWYARDHAKTCSHTPQILKGR